MCTSYESTSPVRFQAFGIFPKPMFEYRNEIYKDYDAPIVRRLDGQLTTDPASFGIVPRRHIPQGVKVFDTMNARAESIGKKRSFRSAWNNCKRSILHT